MTVMQEKKTKGDELMIKGTAAVKKRSTFDYSCDELL